MPAPKGHELWGNPLKPKSYTPQEFWDKACEYFEWCKKHPWVKREQKKGNTSFNVKGDFKASAKALSGIVEIPVERPYSIEGFCIYAGINKQTFYNYAKKEGYETYFDICAYIQQVIDTQHFEGGMTGAFDAGIVARKLGLAEKRQSDINVNMPKIEVTDKETQEAIKDLFKEK